MHWAIFFVFFFFSLSQNHFYISVFLDIRKKNTSGSCNYLPESKTVTVATRILQNKSSAANLKFPALVSLTMFSINNFVTCFCELSLELPAPAMIQYGAHFGQNRTTMKRECSWRFQEINISPTTPVISFPDVVAYFFPRALQDKSDLLTQHWTQAKWNVQLPWQQWWIDLKYNDM